MKVVIIEDEPSPRDELIRLLNKVKPSTEILACLETVKTSVQWFKQHIAADLVFMDIQLGDGLSFEIFQETEVRYPVIFTTAFSEHALRAFKVNGIEYLLKPLDELSLVLALAKFENLKHQLGPQPDTNLARFASLLESMKVERSPLRKRFLIYIGDRVKHIAIEDIAYFYAEEDVVFIMCRNAERFICDLTLEQIYDGLEHEIFFRLNRGLIASIGSIKETRKHFNGRLKIVLHPVQQKDDCFVSRQRVPDFLKWLGR